LPRFAAISAAAEADKFVLIADIKDTAEKDGTDGVDAAAGIGKNANRGRNGFEFAAEAAWAGPPA
jgi:hypothetical protein